MIKKAFVCTALAAVCASTMCIAGCGSSDNAGSSNDQQKEAVEQPANAENPDNVTIGKATIQKDYAGKKRVVVTIEWTNNGDETSSFFTEYSLKAYQDDEEIDRSFGNGDDWYNDQKNVKPGKTQTFKAMFESSGKKDVDVEVSELFGSDVIVSKTFEL